MWTWGRPLFPVLGGRRAFVPLSTSTFPKSRRGKSDGRQDVTRPNDTKLKRVPIGATVGLVETSGAAETGVP